MKQNRQIRTGLLLVLVMLGIITGYIFHQQRQPQYQYRVTVFSAPGGWGYDILKNNQLFIHQPTIPGQPGQAGFVNEAQARRVGKRVVEKLEQTRAMPTLSNDELRQLGVTIP